MRDAELRTAFEEHKTAVYQFAWRMTGSTSIAEDIAQDVFLTLLRGGGQIDKSRGSVRAFLLGIARNLALKRLRYDARWSSLDDQVPVSDPPDIESLSMQHAISAAVAALPPLQREVLILVTYEGMSLPEIANLTGTEITAVKARLHRARENLKRTLSPCVSPVTKAHTD
jgi:RNA polymerase sigma-70 factor (ECF subfamily)